MALSKHWLNHIEAWQSSGLSQTAYCRQQGLNSHSFAARLSDYRRSRLLAASALIPIQVQAPVIESLVLHHNKGHRLELPPAISSTWLAELLRCLD
jgi:hypothetical protein